MYDDDLSFLLRFQEEFRKYDFEIYYPDDYSFMGVKRMEGVDVVMVIEKVKGIPCYKAYLIAIPSSTRAYVREWQDKTLLSWAFQNKSQVLDFHAASFSGHLPMETIVHQVLREKFA